MKKCFVFLLIIALSSCVASKGDAPRSDIKENKDVYTRIEESKNQIKIQLTNNTTDKKYLLSSYFNGRFKYNQNLYKMNGDTLMISFEPVLPYIGTIKSDVLVIDDYSIYKKNQVVFEFEELLSEEAYVVILEKKKLKEISKYRDNSSIIVRFAIYNNTDLLKIEGIETSVDFKDNFIQQAAEYEVITAFNGNG